ncbi:MAG: DUF4136 domain-containing protein [Aquincola sp.]|nr:DUF4136 domain-containing protein [Aquincola sp.]MDH4289375.1 DUF4136 domain-containing protein [Aquincola sp.]MDH5328506.1 DUF4136 domain-containing protein [Aquincola sp.]
MTILRRTLLMATGAAAALGGCAALNTVTSEVATYGDWPPDRKPGRYVFERLPSQKSGELAKRQEMLEAAAAKALEKAGFTPASEASQADVVVQIGARLTRIDMSPWDDPLWWHWGMGYWRSPAWRPSRAPYYSPYWGLRADWSTRYERNVALLLRDRASNTPLYEAHAQTEGGTSGDTSLIEAMFEAALKDFPALGATNPRRVSVVAGS